MNQTTCFGLLRHGETVWNRQKRMQGRRDSPLTSAGIAACRRWGRFLAASRWSWQRIICSPSTRTRESARIINEELGLDIETADDLREQDWGAWEGLTMQEIIATFSDQAPLFEQAGWAFRPPSGESRDEVRRRACGVLRDYGKTYPGQQILVISHQTVIKSLIYSLENRRFLPGEPRMIKKNRLHIIGLYDGRFVAGEYNIDLPEPP